MAIIIDQKTTCMIQGITGKEGQRALAWMRANGTHVAAGVTPGKGGQVVQDIPVYNSVAEALAKHPEITATSLYVPPAFVLSAAREALMAGLSLVHILAEGVPTRDTVALLELAAERGARVVGPSSIGILSPGKALIGQLGGGETTDFLAPDPDSSREQLRTGVVVVSKSGGMANTIAHALTLSGIPQSTIIGIGGDRVIGTAYADVLEECQNDAETRAMVIIGEIGGAYEEKLAEAMLELDFKKPVVAFISGLFAETLPQGVAFGHAGAIVSKTEGTRAGKIVALQQAGAHIAQTPTEIASLLSQFA